MFSAGENARILRAPDKSPPQAGYESGGIPICAYVDYRVLRVCIQVEHRSEYEIQSALFHLPGYVPGFLVYESLVPGGP